MAKTVNLKFINRIQLLNLLPKEGSYRTLKLLRQLKEELSLSDKENKALKIVEDQKTGTIRWDAKADKGKKIEIGDTMVDVIKKSLIDLDKEEKLGEHLFELYEIFVETE